MILDDQVLYHGTNQADLKKLKSGITPDDEFKGVSLTNDPEEALLFAQEKADRSGGKPIVYKVQVKKGSKNLVDFREVMEELGEDYTDADVQKFLKDNNYDGIDYSSEPMLGYGIRFKDPKNLKIVGKE